MPLLTHLQLNALACLATFKNFYLSVIFVVKSVSLIVFVFVSNVF